MVVVLVFPGEEISVIPALESGERVELADRQLRSHHSLLSLAVPTIMQQSNTANTELAPPPHTVLTTLHHHPPPELETSVKPLL